MNPAVTPFLLAFANSPLLAARFTMPLSEEVSLGAAAVLTIVGVVLHWQLPRQRMSVEESVKDGNLTEEQANQRLKILSICAPTVTVLGVILMLAILLGYME